MSLTSDTFLSFEKVVRARRSIRQFSSEKVPKEVIQKAIDLALLAPNSSNLQPWEFYHIVSESAHQKMVEHCFSQSAARTASDLVAIVVQPESWKQGCDINIKAINENTNLDPKLKKFALEYYQKIIPMTYRSDIFGILNLFKTIMFFIIGLFRATYRGPFGHSGNLLVSTKTVALAAENFMLAISAAGYDSCPMEGFDQWRVKKLLNLPCSAYVAMVVAVGKRDPQAQINPQLRGPREFFVKEL